MSEDSPATERFVVSAGPMPKQAQAPWPVFVVSAPAYLPSAAFSDFRSEELSGYYEVTFIPYARAEPDVEIAEDRSAQHDLVRRLSLTAKISGDCID